MARVPSIYRPATRRWTAPGAYRQRPSEPSETFFILSEAGDRVATENDEPTIIEAA